MALTDSFIKNIKPGPKNKWISDTKGLRLLVKPSGAMYWRLAYRVGKKQKTLAMGVYPEVSLKNARLERDKARIQISLGNDPAEVRKEQKSQVDLSDAKLFSHLAKYWWNHTKGTWSKDHADRVWKRLEENSFKVLNQKPIEKIRPKDVREVIRHIEKRNALDVACRVLSDIKRVFAYGVEEEWIEFNPISEMKNSSIKAHKTEHRPSMQNEELGVFLLALDSYGQRGRTLTKYAIQLLVLTFLRPGELRGAKWEEFDIKERIWRIPEERMKMGAPHLVPLSTQAIQLLTKIRQISGQYDLLFPSERNRKKPMSDNTMNRAIKKLGYDGNTLGKSKAVPHGFRANASSTLNEHGFNVDAIERQLSHMERNDVRAAYIYHAHYMDIRKEMMQWWADHLDTKKQKAKEKAKNLRAQPKHIVKIC